MLAMCVLVCISLILFFLHLLVKSVRQTANVMSEMLYPSVASLSLFLKTQVVEEAKALSKKAKQSLQISSSPPVLLKISENGSSSKSL